MPKRSLVVRGEETEGGGHVQHAAALRHRDAAVLRTGIAERVLVEQHDMLAHPDRLEAHGLRTAAEVADHRGVASGDMNVENTPIFMLAVLYAAASTMRAAFSPIMMEGALVLPEVSVGMIEASATRSPRCHAREVGRQPQPSDPNPSCRCPPDDRWFRRCA